MKFFAPLIIQPPSCLTAVVRVPDAEPALDEWSALAAAVRKRSITEQECKHRHDALIGQFLQA